MKIYPKKLLSGSAIASLLFATSTAKAGVIIYFDEVGSDVIITWTGTLELNGSVSESIDPFVGSFFGPDYHTHDGGSAYSEVANSGTENGTALIDVDEGLSGVPGADSLGSFGFDVADLYFTEADHLTGGTNANPTQLTFLASRDFFTVEGESLASIGAGAFDEELAWTANGTGDTIVYQTGPVPVPEPSSALLCALGSLALLRRKR